MRILFMSLLYQILKKLTSLAGRLEAEGENKFKLFVNCHVSLDSTIGGSYHNEDCSENHNHNHGQPSKANNETKKHRNRQTTFTWNPCVVNTKNPRKRNPPNQNQGRSYHFFEAGKSPIFTYQTLRLSRVFPSAFHPSNSTCNLAKPKKTCPKLPFSRSFQSCCFGFLCRFLFEKRSHHPRKLQHNP